VNRISQKEVLDFCIAKKISFSVFRNPGTEQPRLLIAKQSISLRGDELSDYLNKDGYIIAPFSLSENETVFLPSDFEMEESISSDEFDEIKRAVVSQEHHNSENYYADYSSYLEQYQKLYSNIKSGVVRKTILSRVKHNKGISNAIAIELFSTLCARYPKAYVFMYFSPQTGLWLGASPELLFKSVNGKAETVSLAGSRRGEDSNEGWKEKELDEQQIVSDFVDSVLHKYGINDAKVVGPETVKAGKVSHLRTSYFFNSSKLENKLGSFIKDMHPTPAVCGLPKKEAMEVIAASEKHNRTYYAGFIGRAEKSALHLFVNIRSMKFVNEGVDLYLGGGITIGSNVEREWQETELKSSTMQDAINEVLLNKR